ncbi:c-type cytochrome [Aquicoccus sp. SCR17]|nr:c-type cytochrome [Carideicomes alvinocaridis]
MRFPLTAAALLLATSLPALAQETGDPEAGEKLFNRCRSCHEIKAEDGTVIQRGGRTGPNLYGIIGRTAGSYDDFRYSDLLEQAGEDGLVWTEALLADYVADPTGFLQDHTGASGRSRMTFRLTRGGADVAAYLGSVAQTQAAGTDAAAAKD